MTMTHKERYLAAVRLERPDIVPIDTSFMDLIHVEKIMGEKIIGSGGGGGGGAWALKQEDLQKDLNEIMMENQKHELEAIKKIDLDAFAVSDYWLFPKGYKHNFIRNDTYTDHWGKVYRVRLDVKTTYWIDGIIKTPEDLDNFVPPDPNELCYDLIDLTIKEAQQEYPVLGWGHCANLFPYLMRGGIDKLTYDIYRNPNFARKLIKIVADTNFEIAKNMIDRGIDLFVESDDIADTKSTLFSPKIFKEFFFPYLKRLIDECHRRGIPFMKHSDGNLYPILDDLISMGVDGLHPIEPGAMNLVDVKRRYGDKIFLRGNVDCMHILPYGSEAEVRKEVRRCIDEAAEGGGFILSDSNSMHSNVKTKNILVMIDEGRKYGRYQNLS
ncbi:MAG: uroporphyrinogen decarboxylase family protein [Candidatus Bathyarchaeota archaeon]|nr:uroporphyrinogen decarboxylase family protein [Candidatus Bathyarchaeota archaeon]